MQLSSTFYQRRSYPSKQKKASSNAEYVRPFTENACAGDIDVEEVGNVTMSHLALCMAQSHHPSHTYESVGPLHHHVRSPPCACPLLLSPGFAKPTFSFRNNLSPRWWASVQLKMTQGMEKGLRRALQAEVSLFIVIMSL